MYVHIYIKRQRKRKRERLPVAYVNTHKYMNIYIAYCPLPKGQNRCPAIHTSSICVVIATRTWNYMANKRIIFLHLLLFFWVAHDSAKKVRRLTMTRSEQTKQCWWNWPVSLDPRSPSANEVQPPGDRPRNLGRACHRRLTPCTHIYIYTYIYTASL